MWKLCPKMLDTLQRNEQTDLGFSSAREIECLETPFHELGGFQPFSVLAIMLTWVFAFLSSPKLFVVRL
jgi:hypothetical protein